MPVLPPLPDDPGTQPSSSLPNMIGIKRYSALQLQDLMHAWGQPTFRAQQLVQWLYAHGARSYQDMINLPAVLRGRLEHDEPLITPELLKRQVSRDGTRKYLLRLADGACVETVGIPEDNRLTVCFSTQVGCAMACTFCATGALGLTRSLAAGEMVDQLVMVAQDFDRRITNAVAMGEGEPFANYDATLAALRLMNSPHGLGIGARHLTISTCGLLEPLGRFSAEPEQFTLAVSLHSAVQTTRDKIMPTLAKQPLRDLHTALTAYKENTGRRPSLEVTLINGVTDTPTEIAALVDFGRDLHCHVNLILLNGTKETKKEKGAIAQTPTSPVRSKAIVAQLTKAGIECSIRRSRGSDIDGACGQLVGLPE